MATPGKKGTQEPIMRSVTPELVPDRMADRLPPTPMQEKGLDGLVAGELPIVSMGERVEE